MIKRIFCFIVILICPFLMAASINPSIIDFNNDLVIDITDLTVFTQSWLSHGGPSDDWNPACDLSMPPDKVIDQADLAAFLEYWLVSIPEPNEFFNAADINDDRVIDVRDYSVFSAAWLSANGAAGWNSACDLADPEAGVIDVNDLMVFVSSWLVTLPDPNDYLNVPDLNSDRIVDLLDYNIFTHSWLADSEPMLNWNPVYDIAGIDDEAVNAEDLAIIAAHWYFQIPDPNEFVYIPGGAFEMGDHHLDAIPVSLPVHTVHLDSFYMGKYEVTNKQYSDYLNSAFTAGVIKVEQGTVYDVDDIDNLYPYFDTDEANTYSQIVFSNGVFSVRYKDDVDMSNYPLIEVSWYGAAAYCNWRSEQEGYSVCYNLSTWECDFTIRGYRLATEAEWEYAARGGQYEPYHRYPWGDTIDYSQANYWPSRNDLDIVISHPILTPVGYYDGNQLPPGTDMANGWGLYDMAGNVLEWCNDWYDGNYYQYSPQNNPTGPAAGSLKVMRGGSWNNPARQCLAAIREDFHAPAQRSGAYGFRIVFGPLPMPN